MKKISITCLAACLSLAAFWLALPGAVQTDDSWQAGKLAQGKIDFTRGTDVFEISFLHDNIVEFNFRPGGQSGAPTPVLAPKVESLVPKVDSPLGAANGTATFSTAGLKVDVSSSPLDVKISDASGKLLCELDQWSADGCVVHHDHHHFFGSEENVEAGGQGHSGGPFVWTTAGYGLLWDSDGGTAKRDDAKLTIVRKSGTLYPRPDFDAYLIVGPPRSILEGLADLSGHAPMFPKWNLGFMVTRWSVDQKEVVQNVGIFREKKIPFDIYIIDYDWFLYGRGDWGDFEWDPKFPDGASGKLCKEILASQGVKMAGIRKPRLGGLTPGKAIDEAQSHGWIMKETNGTKEFNFHIKEASDWWWSHTQPLFESGLAGFWNDEGDYDGNFHFMEMQRCQYEGQRSISNQRVWSLDRNFYPGSQRYAYALWSGDIGSGFKSMGEQRARMLQSVSIGEPWWSMDTGGFHDNPSPENYGRWIEFATFVPIMRVHGAMPAKREPWNYGPQAEAVAKKYIELRYRLLPYLYSSAWQITRHGLPLARPMWLDYSDDAQVTDKMTEQWMVGDYLLVRPVVDEGATSSKIYLPRGTWIDFWTGESHAGNQWIDRAADAKNWDDLPLYVKRGAIIPTAPPMLYVGQVPMDPLTIEVYPDAEKTSFTYYDDDGATYGYEKKVYAEIPMETGKTADRLFFQSGEASGTYVPATHTFVVKFHLLDEKRHVQSVTLEGRALAQVDSVANLDAKDEGWAMSSDPSGPIVEVRYRVDSGPQAQNRRFQLRAEVILQ